LTERLRWSADAWPYRLNRFGRNKWIVESMITSVKRQKLAGLARQQVVEPDMGIFLV
jgi:hypothetical protein